MRFGPMDNGLHMVRYSPPAMGAHSSKHIANGVPPVLLGVCCALEGVAFFEPPLVFVRFAVSLSACEAP